MRASKGALKSRGGVRGAVDGWGVARRCRGAKPGMLDIAQIGKLVFE